jgi:ABC-type multidrug transport system ATPase subunit
VIIDRGRVVADGTPAELLARSRHHNAVTLVLAGCPGRNREGEAENALTASPMSSRHCAPTAWSN